MIDSNIWYLGCGPFFNIIDPLIRILQCTTVKPRLSRVIIYNDFQENIFYYNKLTYHIILL